MPDFKAQMDADMVHTMCQFQMQIFKSFMENAKRRLDRWNMRVVMNASYFLLHLYVQEYGVTDVHGAALVVACIYLAGKVSRSVLSEFASRVHLLSFVTLCHLVPPCPAAARSGTARTFFLRSRLSSHRPSIFSSRQISSGPSQTSSCAT
jgi:hypothetical protein